MSGDSSANDSKEKSLEDMANAWLEKLCDTDERERTLALHAFQVQSSEEVYSIVLQALVDFLQPPLKEAQALVLEILGLLRDEKLVPSILPHVISPKPSVAMAAQSALALLCARSFGSDTRAWTDWWNKNRSASRKRWLLDALKGKDPVLQSIAQKELKLLKGQSE